MTILVDIDEGPSGLYPALLAAKAEIGTLPKDAINPHFKSKYVALDTIVEHVEPVLTKHGLVWITKPGRNDEGAPSLRYRLVYAATGEAEEGSMDLLLVKNDPQGQGSAITYARRYALTSVLNLVADADDDGEATRAAARGDASYQQGSHEKAAKAALNSEKPAAAAPSGPSQTRADRGTLTAIRGLYKRSGWPEAKLRVALVAIGAQSEGAIADVMNGLTVEQAESIREQLLVDVAKVELDAKEEK